MKSNKLLKGVGYTFLAIAGIVFFIFSGQIGKFYGKKAMTDYVEGRKDGSIEKLVKITAEDLRKGLPREVGGVIMYDVLAIDKTLTYFYRVPYKLSEIDGNWFMRDQVPALKHNVCKQESMSNTIRKHGVTYGYMYFSQDGLLVGEIDIGRKECNY